MYGCFRCGKDIRPWELGVCRKCLESIQIKDLELEPPTGRGRFNRRPHPWDRPEPARELEGYLL